MTSKLTIQFDGSEVDSGFAEIEKRGGKALGTLSSKAEEYADRLKDAAGALDVLSTKQEEIAKNRFDRRKELMEIEHQLKMERTLAREQSQRRIDEARATGARLADIKKLSDAEIKANADRERAEIERLRRNQAPQSNISAASTKYIDEERRRAEIAEAADEKIAESARKLLAKREAETAASSKREAEIVVRVAQQIVADKEKSDREYQLLKEKLIAEGVSAEQAAAQAQKKIDEDNLRFAQNVLAKREAETAASSKREAEIRVEVVKREVDLAKSSEDSERQLADMRVFYAKESAKAAADAILKQASAYPKLMAELDKFKAKREEVEKSGAAGSYEFVKAYEEVAAAARDATEIVATMNDEVEKLAQELEAAGDSKGAAELRKRLENANNELARFNRGLVLSRTNTEDVGKSAGKVDDEFAKAVKELNRFSLSQERLLSSLSQVERVITNLEKLKSRTPAQDAELQQMVKERDVLQQQVDAAEKLRAIRTKAVETTFAAKANKTEDDELARIEALNRARGLSVRMAEKASDDQIRANNRLLRSQQKVGKAIIDGGQAMLINTRWANEAFNAAQRFDEGGVGKLTVSVLALIAAFKGLNVLYKDAVSQHLGLSVASGKGTEEYIRLNQTVGTLTSGVKSAVSELNFMKGAVEALSDTSNALKFSSLIPGNDMFASLSVGAVQLGQDIVSLGGLFENFASRSLGEVAKADERIILLGQIQREANKKRLDDLAKMPEAENQIAVARARAFAASIADLETLQSQYQQLLDFQHDNPDMYLTDEGRERLHEAQLRAAAVLDRIASDQAELAGLLDSTLESVSKIGIESARAFHAMRLGTTESIDETKELIAYYEEAARTAVEGSDDQRAAVELLAKARDRAIDQLASARHAEDQAMKATKTTTEEATRQTRLAFISELEYLHDIHSRRDQYIEDMMNSAEGSKEHAEAIEGVNAAIQAEIDLLKQLHKGEIEASTISRSQREFIADRSNVQKEVASGIKDEQTLENAAASAARDVQNADNLVDQEIALNGMRAAEAAILDLRKQNRQLVRDAADTTKEIADIAAGRVQTIEEEINGLTQIDELLQKRALMQEEFGEGSKEDLQALADLSAEYATELANAEAAAQAIQAAINAAAAGGDLGKAEAYTKELERQKQIVEELAKGAKIAADEPAEIQKKAAIEAAKDRKKEFDDLKKKREEIKAIQDQIDNLNKAAAGQMGDELKGTLAVIEALKKELESAKSLDTATKAFADFKQAQFDQRVKALEDFLQKQQEGGGPTVLQNLANRLNPRDVDREVRRRREEEIARRTEEFANAQGLAMNDKSVLQFQNQIRRQVMSRDSGLERQDVMSDMVSAMVRSAQEQGRISKEAAGAIQKQIDKADEQIDAQLQLTRTIEDFNNLAKGKALKDIAKQAGAPPQPQGPPGAGGGFFSVPSTLPAGNAANPVAALAASSQQSTAVASDGFGVMAETVSKLVEEQSVMSEQIAAIVNAVGSLVANATRRNAAVRQRAFNSMQKP